MNTNELLKDLKHTIDRAQAMDEFITALYRAQLRLELIHILQSIECFSDDDE